MVRGSVSRDHASQWSGVEGKKQTRPLRDSKSEISFVGQTVTQVIPVRYDLNLSSASVPMVQTNTGARGFRSCTLSLWNNLPLSDRLAP